MFKLFKRTAQTPEIKQEEQIKTYPTWSVFTYGSGGSLKQQVAPDFTSNITNVVKEGDRITVFFEEGYIEIPANQAIVVKRYFTDGR